MIFLNCHTHFPSNPSTEILQVGLQESNNGFYSLGIHPWEAELFNDIQGKSLESNCSNSNCLAIGEVGLDKLKDPSLEIQMSVFRKQIGISERHHLPVIIHCVKAWNELREIKRAEKPKQSWIFHGFAQANIVSEVIKENLMISLGSRILNHPKKEIIVDAIPDNQLLLETDDEAIDIKVIYECVAELKKISLQELSDLIKQNFQNTFPKWQIGLSEQN